MIARKSFISFGLVAIPIAMYTATEDKDIHFNQLYKEDKTRIRYKKVCEHCGKDITADDIVRGYEYEKDQYIIVTDEELEKIKTEKEKSIQIFEFVQMDEISPLYYDKTYLVTPDKGGEKAFELLRKALMDEQKIAIGKTVLGTKETMMAIIPNEEGILISTMHYADEVRELQHEYVKPSVSKEELKMAKTLIESMDATFDPSKYKDEYQLKLRALIDDKIAGNEIVAPQQESPSNIIDLMDALKASIEKNKSKKEPA